MSRNQELEIHVASRDGKRRIILLPSHITLESAVAMAKQGTIHGTYTYAGVYVNGKVYCEYEA